jgi:hypothetical protein
MIYIEFLSYANDMNLLEDNMETGKKHTETSIDGSKVVGL